MARRFRRASTRSRRTRRPRRIRRRRIGRGIRPDGMHKERVTIRVDIVNDTANSAYHNFHWLQETVGGLDNTGIKSGNSQHQNFLNLYQFWMVYGMQLKYIPRVYGQAGSNNKAVVGGYIGSLKSSDTGTVTEASIRNSKDYMPFDPTKGFKRYYRIGKYLKHTADKSWEPSGGSYPPNFDMKTYMFIEGENLGTIATTNLGYMYVTYYVMYKGRKYL